MASDIASLIQQNGLSYVETQLEEWLIEYTQKGSGDDITLGLMYGTEVKKQPESDFQTKIADIHAQYEEQQNLKVKKGEDNEQHP